MLDKVLRVLDADPGFDDRVGIASLVGSYIKRNINGTDTKVTPEYIKEIAFPDRKQQLRQKMLSEQGDIIAKYKEYVEKERVEKIRKSQSDALSGIYNKTEELRGETDKISLKSGEIEQNLLQKHEALEERLESLAEQNKSSLEKQLERIETGEKEIAARFNQSFKELDEKMPTIGEELKKSVLDWEARFVAEKIAEKEAEENKPKPVYEQVLIEETGQIITLEK